MNLLDVHTHLLHNLHTIAETEHDTFLCSSYDMGTIMLGKAQATDRTAHFTILQYALCSISKRNDLHAIAANRHTGSQIVHICIAYIWRDVTMYPSIQNTSTIYTEQHSQAVEFRCIVDMCEGIDTTLWIVIDITEHTIDYSGSSCGAGNLTRIEHIQADSIIRLVTCTIRDRSSLLQTKFLSGSLADYALNREGRNNICEHTLIESEIIKQELGRLLCLEVPHHTLRKSADSSLSLTGKFHCQIITWEHNLINLTEKLWLILLDPRQFGSGKVAWRIEQITQAEVLA